jgi:hypothetical protein
MSTPLDARHWACHGVYYAKAISPFVYCGLVAGTGLSAPFYSFIHTTTLSDSTQIPSLLRSNTWINLPPLQMAQP